MATPFFANISYPITRVRQKGVVDIFFMLTVVIKASSNHTVMKPIASNMLLASEKNLVSMTSRHQLAEKLTSLHDVTIPKVKKLAKSHPGSSKRNLKLLRPHEKL